MSSGIDRLTVLCRGVGLAAEKSISPAKSVLVVIVMAIHICFERNGGSLVASNMNSKDCAISR